MTFQHKLETSYVTENGQNKFQIYGIMISLTSIKCKTGHFQQNALEISQRAAERPEFCEELQRDPAPDEPAARRLGRR